MAILAECPICRKKQSNRNRLCSCGEDLIKAKRSKRVRYWITYRLPGGKQRRESVGYSLEEARAAEGKRKAQKKEGRILDLLPESTMTFQELTEWYVNLESVRAIKTFWRIKIALKHFNSHYGNTVIRKLKQVDLESYQAKRKQEQAAGSTIDKEVSIVHSMANKAFDNDLVKGECLKPFKKVKSLLKRNENARDTILRVEQFHALMSALPYHTKAIVATAYFTGMRKGEILSLTWDTVDVKNRAIRLRAKETKDKEPRIIPICDELATILETIPKAIHDNHVFLYEEKPYRDIRAALRRGCKQANIPYGRDVKHGFVFHDLRHTFNTNMRKAGVSESVIMQITGHSTREMFDRYNTVDERDGRIAMEKFESYFLQSVDQNVDHTKKRGQHDCDNLC